MSYQMPTPGTYRRKSDGVLVEVTNCTGTSGMSTVTVKSAKRTSHVFIENFWRKYEPAGGAS